MVIQKIRHRIIMQPVLICLTVLLVIGISCKSAAQEMPPRPVAIYYTQSLSFGAFSLGISGGTVIISASGIRSFTGGIILVGLGFPFYPAIFSIEGNPGTVIHPLPGSDATLNGSNGGFLTVHLGNTDPGDPIIINAAPPSQVQVKLGGTLYVGTNSANPPGIYNGTFSIMFIQE